MTAVAAGRGNGIGDLVDPKAPSVEVVETIQDSTKNTDPAGRHVSEDDWVYPYPTDFKLSEHPIDDIRKLKVAVIGAGLAGVTAGALLPAKVPGIQLTILEKNSDVGGTWFENRYPGVRCDIPANVYQTSLAPNTQWSEEYAQGPEILAYWKRIAERYDVYNNIRFEVKVLKAEWEPQKAQWDLQHKDLKTGVTKTEYFDFVISAIGHFNEWKLPYYPGIDQYKGHLRHSSNWDPTFDPTGKRVATIGNGASGIQVTPELQKVASHVDHYARSPTWIAGSFNGSARERQATPLSFTPEELESFKDPATYLKFRKELEGPFFRRFDAVLRDSEPSKNAARDFREFMRKRLVDKPELLDQIVPDFPPPTTAFTDLSTLSSALLVRTSTSVLAFPIIAGDLDLSRDWKPDGKFGWPYSYIGLATPGFPNLLQLHGPNAAGASGSVPHSVESQVAYIAKVFRKASSQGIATIQPSKAAADDFVTYCDAFFPRTTFSRKCSSWANGRRPGGRIHGLWPGSASHLAVVRREPRWEDWEYTYVRPENRFAYWGNGWTRRELDPDSDTTAHLKLPEEIDLRDLHERWWDL
ncbi:FAD/NAD(P)-binding domain-containing protein [Aureobasidium pullulans]|uniref:FAD/NAD(P)-binding domain-containing protein n=1 Tax=Aureobasidium pullulans TaxID=5580 RepID=A0AB74JCY2_AURPU|nr:FAD/NAD(P)-binding domain-containing protein [Aureobasidium pullulans]THX36545.1 FAD/NAD(P)-binding domain-containing protein [Aureobasidium pullulans]